MSERLIRLLRARVAPADGVADAELLLRWADRRDEAAFELILRRHAEPVWRTCRAVAGEGAEDAFQATFLALARRAGAVRGNVPGWLHRVARHASLRARRFVGRVESSRPDIRDALRCRASQSLDPTYDEPDLAVLHAELARLPDAYRLPVLLCHLHGRTQAQAAAELGLPLGTVATRVRRGCDRLRTALTRRGLAPSLAFGPPLVLPASLIPATLGVGLGATAAPPTIHTLANGAVSAMSYSKLRATLAVVAMGCAVTGGAIVARGPAANPQPPKPAPQPVAQKWEAKPADYFDRRASSNRLKSVLIALHGYSSAHDDRLPGDILGADGKPLLSWRVAVLPYVDQELLYGMFKLDEPWDGPTNKPLMKHVPSVYRSAGAGPGLTRVKMFRGEQAALNPTGQRKMPDGFPDGTSNTAGAVDAGAAVEWTKPGDLDFARDKPLPDLTGPFTDGYAAGYMDGSVRWHSADLPEKFLRLVIERDDGMVVQEPAGPPRPRRPLTEREKNWLEKQIKPQLAYIPVWWSSSENRARVSAELAKHGPVPPPAPSGPDDLALLEMELEAAGRRDQVDTAETQRLLDVLATKDKPLADKLRKDFFERRQKMVDELRRKQ